MKQALMTACKVIENQYKLIGDTFSKKEEIKNLGGKWDGRNWIIPLSALSVLKPLVRVKIKVNAHCHKPEEIMYANGTEILNGFIRLGCDKCDTPASCGENVKILEVIDKELEDLIRNNYAAK